MLQRGCRLKPKASTAKDMTRTEHVSVVVNSLTRACALCLIEFGMKYSYESGIILRSEP